MIIHYFKMAFRSLMRYKIQNIISISVGFVCFAFSMIWIRYELGYDNFHRGADRIYVLYSIIGIVIMDLFESRLAELSGVTGSFYISSLFYFMVILFLSVCISFLIIRFYIGKSISEMLNHRTVQVMGTMVMQMLKTTWDYYWGKGVDKDYSEAKRLFQQASAQGHSYALEFLIKVENKEKIIDINSTFDLKIKVE